MAEKTKSKINVDYSKLFNLPQEYRHGEGANCKICRKKLLYDKNSKRNLKKHYENQHPKELISHLKQIEDELNKNTRSQGTIMLTPECITTNLPAFSKQKVIETAIADLLVCQGGLPVTTNNIESSQQNKTENFRKDGTRWIFSKTQNSKLLKAKTPKFGCCSFV